MPRVATAPVARQAITGLTILVLGPSGVRRYSPVRFTLIAVDGVAAVGTQSLVLSDGYF